MNKLFSKIAALSVGLAMAIGVGVAVGSKEAKAVRASEPDTDKYQKITAVSGLSAGDKAVLYNATDNEGVTGTSGTKDASVASSGWLEYTVAKTASGFTLEASSGSYVTLGTKSFSHSSTATDLSVTSNGYLCTVANNDNILYHQNSYVRTYTGKSSDSTYHPFAVYKVLNSGPVVSYTITYDANGGSGSMSSTTNTVAACTFTAPEGKRFASWNTAANGSGTTYNPGASATADLDLFAIWEDKPLAVTLDKIGTTLGSTANTTMATVDIADGSDTYTLNYLQCKKQGDSMFMTKSVNPFISNHTEMPGDITSVEVFINSGASGSTTYDVAFGTSEYTTATAGIGAENITGGNSHVFENTSVTGAKYFCITLGNANNGQVLKVVVNYEESGDPTKDTLVVKLNDNLVSPQTVNYTPVSGWLFYANDKDGNDINSDWESSNESIFTVSKNGNNVAVVTPHDIGTATLTASAEGFNSGSFVLTIVPGTLESIAVTGSMTKTSYYVGEDWSHDGLVATGSYSTGYEGDVSSEATWTYSAEKPLIPVTNLVVTASIGTVSGSSAVQHVTVSRTNPIQVLYTKADNTDVDVYGVYVGFLDGTGPVIMDGAYGMVCYNKTADVSGYTAGTTILHVTGKMGTYHGLRQVTSPVLSVASGTYDVPENPVVYATQGGETAEYASRLTTVTGVPSLYPDPDNPSKYGDFSADAGAIDIRMKFAVGGQEVVVFYKKAAQEADADAYAAIKAAVAGSSEITIKGFTGWYDGFQVQMNGYIPPAEGYTAEDFAQDLLDQTDAVCAGWEEGDNNHDALEAIWSNLASNDKYPSLPSAEKTILAEAERDESGTVVEQAMARYDFLTGKYNLSNFINGRTPIVPAGMMYADNLTTTNSTMVVIVVIASISVLAFTTLLVFKKKKQK